MNFTKVIDRAQGREFIICVKLYNVWEFLLLREIVWADELRISIVYFDIDADVVLVLLLRLKIARLLYSVKFDD